MSVFCEHFSYDGVTPPLQTALRYLTSVTVIIDYYYKPIGAPSHIMPYRAEFVRINAGTIRPRDGRSKGP